MIARLIKVKNVDTVSHHWGDREYSVNDEHIIEDIHELDTYQHDNNNTDSFYSAVSSGKAQITGDNGIFANYAEAWQYIIGLHKQEVVPLAPKNEYDLRPYGLSHVEIDSSDQVYDITLSNKSSKDIDYSNCGTTPQFYDCIFQNHSQIRDGVESIDGSTITTFMGRLAEGSAKLSRPVNIDYKIETIEDVATIYLWGIFFDAENYGDDDIVRLQICDPDEVGVAAGLYTSEQIQAMGYIVKEYDECWVRQLTKIIEVNTPDGSPGEILNGMVLRVKYYCKDITKTSIKAWVDYKITIKDS